MFIVGNHLRNAVANVFNILTDDLDTRGIPANDFLYNGQNSAWADASQRFTASTTGEVLTITPFADSTRVFAQTEVAALLDNPNVTNINGYPKDYFVHMKADAMAQGLSEAQALDRVQSTVSTISLDRTATLQFSLDAQGNIARDAIGSLQPIGTAEFFNGTPINGSSLPDTTAHTFGGNIMAGAMQSPLDQPKTLSVSRGLPSQYFNDISAMKPRRWKPLILEAARRMSAICSCLRSLGENDKGTCLPVGATNEPIIYSAAF